MWTLAARTPLSAPHDLNSGSTLMYGFHFFIHKQLTWVGRGIVDNMLGLLSF